MRVIGNSAWTAKLIASVISAKPQPEVPHIALLPVKLAHRTAFATAISSSACKNVTFFELITSLKTVEAGVIGYAA